jgi:hypothetical protein
MMTTLSRVDPTVEVACALPGIEASKRLSALQVLIGDRLDHVSRRGEQLRIRLARAGDADLDAKATEWAEAEKGCCPFLGFAIESHPEAVTLEITAPATARSILAGIELIVRAAGRLVAGA